MDAPAEHVPGASRQRQGELPGHDDGQLDNEREEQPGQQDTPWHPPRPEQPADPPLEPRGRPVEDRPGRLFCLFRVALHLIEPGVDVVQQERHVADQAKRGAHGQGVHSDLVQVGQIRMRNHHPVVLLRHHSCHLTPTGSSPGAEPPTQTPVPRAERVYSPPVQRPATGTQIRLLTGRVVTGTGPPVTTRSGLRTVDTDPGARGSGVCPASLPIRLTIIESGPGCGISYIHILSALKCRLARPTVCCPAEDSCFRNRLFL
jgi:hypothetical protein